MWAQNHCIWAVVVKYIHISQYVCWEYIIPSYISNNSYFLLLFINPKNSGACSVTSFMCKYFRPWTAAHQAPLSLGFPKQEYWSRSTELDRVGHQPSTKPSFWTENNSIILRCNYGDSKRTLNINVLNKALFILSMGKCGFSICKGFVCLLPLSLLSRIQTK